MTMEGININSDEINDKLKPITLNSIIKEIACHKSLLAYYEDVQLQIELISTLNSNIQVVLQRSKAIKAKGLV
jgi:hypothetical protein